MKMNQTKDCTIMVGRQKCLDLSSAVPVQSKLEKCFCNLLHCRIESLDNELKL